MFPSVVDVGTHLVIALTCASAPQGGAVTMMLLLEALGLPPTAIALVMPIDWLCNRLRSTVNVLGRCIYE